MIFASNRPRMHRSTVESGLIPHGITNPAHVPPLQRPPHALENRSGRRSAATCQVLVRRNHLWVMIIEIVRVRHGLGRVNSEDLLPVRNVHRRWGGDLVATRRCCVAVRSELVNDPRRRSRFAGIVERQRQAADVAVVAWNATAAPDGVPVVGSLSVWADIFSAPVDHWPDVFFLEFRHVRRRWSLIVRAVATEQPFASTDGQFSALCHVTRWNLTIAYSMVEFPASELDFGGAPDQPEIHATKVEIMAYKADLLHT